LVSLGYPCGKKTPIPCGILVVPCGILVVHCGILVVPCGKKTCPLKTIVKIESWNLDLFLHKLYFLEVIPVVNCIKYSFFKLWEYVFLKIHCNPLITAYVLNMTHDLDIEIILNISSSI
jgi:hypothetical protein